MTKTLLLSPFILTFFLSIHSCKPLQKVDQESNQETMYSPKITAEDLAKTTPISIKTDQGVQTVYAVIIFTEDAASLKKQGILVQSVSKEFVTALIKKEDLEKINQNKSVKSVQLPQTDYPTNNQLID